MQVIQRMASYCTIVNIARTISILFAFNVMANTVSLAQETDTLVNNLKKARQTVTSKLDSLPTWNADSLKLKTRLDSVSNKLNNSLDSLNKLELPKSKRLHKMDSVMKATQAKVNKKIRASTDSLSAKANETINRYEQKLQEKSQRLDSLAEKFDLNIEQPNVNVQIDPAEFKMPEVGSPEFEKPDFLGLAMPGLNLPSLNVPVIDNATEAIDEVSQAANKAGKYAEKLEEIKDVDIKEEAKKLPEELEEQATKIEGVENVNHEMAKTDKIKDQLEELKTQADPANATNEIKKRSKKVLINHMAGKEEVINKGLQQMEKYQKKYNTLHDIRKLPEKKPNNMKGKPFIERITPGLQFEVTASDGQWKAIDISPSFEYWPHHKFRIGIGGSYRMNINTKSFQATDGDNVYSFMGMARYKFYKGLFAHLEYQVVRTNSDGTQSGTTDPDHRVWNKSLNTGLFKSYQINKWIRGTMLVIYDLTTIDETFNISQLGFRFGVECKFKRNKKEDGKEKAGDTK